MISCMVRGKDAVPAHGRLSLSMSDSHSPHRDRVPPDKEQLAQGQSR